MRTRGAVALLLAAGGGLRAIQYFSDGSLWVDEAALALNLASRPLGRLLAPLDLAQVAPWGFLAVEKALLAVFGRGELGLRLLPFLASLAALPLFARLGRQALTGLAPVFAAGCFALATGLIDYAGQLKQYATDVSAALAVLVVALPLARSRLTLRRAAPAALAGIAACFLSHSAVFLLAGAGASLLLLAAMRRIEASVPALAVLLAAWGLGVAFVAWSARRSVTPEVDAYLADFWSSGFPPRHTTGAASWLIRQILGVFGAFLDYPNPLPWLFAALLVAGVISLWRRNLAAALLLSTPVLAALAASALRLYPFAPGRATAFVVPIFLILAAEGFERARRPPWRGLSWAGFLIAAAAAACPVLAVAGNPPPYVHENIRPALDRLRREWNSGDALYVFYGARLPYLFHATAPKPAGGDVVLGQCARRDPRRYLAELDRFRGRPRLWVLISHDLPVFGEGEVILGYLDRIGRPLERGVSRSKTDLSPVILAAYDLSDSGRASADSATFPVSGPSPETVSRLPCSGTMGPIPAGLLPP